MEFSKEAKKRLEKAGWYVGRNVISQLKLAYNDYPTMAVEFLSAYGNLQIECEKQDYTSVVNQLDTNPETPEHLLKGDNYHPYYSSILNKKLYPLGWYYPNNYLICCDVDGRVYMIGENCYYKGKNLYEGIENIFLMNTLKSLQLDDDTGKWWNMQGEYVTLP